MTLVTATLQRLFARTAAARPMPDRRATPRVERRRQPRDFADTRPLVFRTEVFADDLCPRASL